MPAKPWSGEKNCTDFGPACYSDHHNPDTCSQFPGKCSENCLNLNIWTPATATPSSKLKVMMWIFGGSFQEGDDVGPFQMYDGAYIASDKNVVIVTVNYRLGALGFLVTDKIGGNFGLLDQRLAMQWINKNIQYFGGDPTDVTLWGESAGAMSIGLHMVSPKSWPYFHRTIQESNPIGLLYKKQDRARVYGLEFCKLVKCTRDLDLVCNTTCMEQVNVKEVLHAWSKAAGNAITFIVANWGHIADGFLEFIPNIDGDIVPEEPIKAMEAGRFHKVPTLVGTNTNEAVAFIYDVKDWLPPFLFDWAVDFVFGAKADQIKKFYHSRIKFDDARKGLSVLFTDFWFRCASEKIVTAVSNHSQPAFMYRYNHVLSAGYIFPKFGLPKQCEKLVCHAAELPLSFHHMKVPALNITLTPEEHKLSQTMVDYWHNFVATNNPNNGPTGGAIKFPAWNGKTRENVVLHEPLSTEDSRTLCEFWDSIGYDY
eukprot:TRINITY_DN37733_c0_g1_i1.p1 TRINITY_DN37733_c0_g1~~TRINITY_DN37733_c0_g1_i1.p1  ORF type:complete len:551 (+),score=99.93 TRINITY_DN37733_c0_g1_i1:208-1653(+)